LGVLLGAAAVAAIAIAFWRAPQPFVAYGILWGAVALAPALNLTGLAQNVFAERYLYLPSVGFCWIAGWLWVLLAAHRWKVAQAAAVAVMLICAADVFLRNRDWFDTYSMLRVTVRQSPDAGLIHDALAGEYVERGQVETALAEERLAVEDEPNMALLHKKLGYILMGKDPRAAATELGKAASLEPEVAQNHFDLAMALEAAGDREQAAAEYRRALTLRPDMAEAKQALERVAGGK
jgi:tetratricopeptide (TPR) repeat protein